MSFIEIRAAYCGAVELWRIMDKNNLQRKLSRVPIQLRNYTQVCTNCAGDNTQSTSFVRSSRFVYFVALRGNGTFRRLHTKNCMLVTSSLLLQSLLESHLGRKLQVKENIMMVCNEVQSNMYINTHCGAILKNFLEYRS